MNKPNYILSAKQLKLIMNNVYPREVMILTNSLIDYSACFAYINKHENHFKEIEYRLFSSLNLIHIQITKLVIDNKNDNLSIGNILKAQDKNFLDHKTDEYRLLVEAFDKICSIHSETLVSIKDFRTIFNAHLLLKETPAFKSKVDAILNDEIKLFPFISLLFDFLILFFEYYDSNFKPFTFNQIIDITKRKSDELNLKTIDIYSI
ncbi:MAG: hypothetical protein AB7E61_03585 [Acholeplasmataceae bacterium]